jgi:recombinational DNA repair protein (RecF pathway)
MQAHPTLYKLLSKALLLAEPPPPLPLLLLLLLQCLSP